MRAKFWEYMQNPTAKAKAQLTAMEQAFAETLKDAKEWPDGQKKPKAAAANPKAK